MFRSLLIPAALAGLLWPAPGIGGTFDTAAMLQRMCTGEDTFANGVCVGYVVAVADVLAEGNAVNRFRSCFTEAVTRGQLADVVVTWLGQHPDDKRYAAAGIVAEALSKAFPCTEG